MDGMQYTPILGEPNLGDSWASSDRALVSMLEDTQLNAKNLGKAAELLGIASDETIKMAAQAREITKAQKDAITWMNKQLREQTGLVTKEIVNSTKQIMFLKIMICLPLLLKKRVVCLLRSFKKQREPLYIL